MDKYTETFETWNKVASLYQEKFMDLNLYNDSYDLFCSYVPKLGAKILEIGCGPGNITKYILTKRPDFDITGIDVAPNMIELAKKNNPSANFEVLDCRAIESLQSKYNAILCGFCIPYLSKEDVGSLLYNCNNLLTENGILYMSFVEGDPERSGFQTGSSGDRCYFYYHTLDMLKTQLTENHFEQFKVLKVEYKRSVTNSELHTILIAKKS